MQKCRGTIKIEGVVKIISWTPLQQIRRRSLGAPSIPIRPTERYCRYRRGSVNHTTKAIKISMDKKKMRTITWQNFWYWGYSIKIYTSPTNNSQNTVIPRSRVFRESYQNSEPQTVITGISWTGNRTENSEPNILWHPWVRHFPP